LRITVAVFVADWALAQLWLFWVAPIVGALLGAVAYRTIAEPKGWSIRHDAKNSRRSSLLAGVNYGQVVTFGGHKWRPNVEVGFDFKDDVGNPKWVNRAGIALLLPK
jgi:hypothetical protein